MRLSRELKARKGREVLTSRQKNILFAPQGAFCGCIIVGSFGIALFKETPLAWIFCVLISIVMLVALYAGYLQIYKDEVFGWKTSRVEIGCNSKVYGMHHLRYGYPD